MTLFEVDEAANRIREEVDNDANIIFGSTFNPNLEGVIRITVVATGIDITKSKHNVALEEHEEEMHSANEESAMNSMEQTLENEENIAESKLAKSSNKSEVLKSEHEEENINVEEENISNNHYLQERAKPATKIQAKVKVDSNVVKKKGFFSRMANSLGFGSDNEEHENQNNNFEQEEVEIPAFLRRKKK
jgi:cell division protein FtsZ